MQAFLRERRPIRQKVNYRCYFLIIILIQKKSPLNSNHVHVFYIHGIVIGLNLVYPWNKTAVSTIFHITIQGKSNPKRMRQKCAVQNCQSYAGKCQYRLFRFPTPCPLSWLAVVGNMESKKIQQNMQQTLQKIWYYSYRKTIKIGCPHKSPWPW